MGRLEGVGMGRSEKWVVFADIYVQSKIMCKFLTIQLNFYIYSIRYQKSGPAEMAQQLRSSAALPEDWGLVPSTNEGCLTAFKSYSKGSDTSPQGPTNKHIHKCKYIFGGEDWYTVLHISL